jgi:bacterioferritin-associated ferredoxin
MASLGPIILPSWQHVHLQQCESAVVTQRQAFLPGADPLAILRESNDNHSHSITCVWPMYICVCAAVSDKAILAAVAEGANSLDDLRVDLGVAMNCGCCAAAAEGIICEAKAKRIHVEDHAMHCAPCHGVSANEPGDSERVEHPANGRPRRVWPILEMA